MEKIKITKISVEKNRATVLFDIVQTRKEDKPLLNSFFKTKKFFVEYSENIENVQKDLFLIPFIGNILPILWITNTKIEVDELDESFFNSIPKFEQGYIDMYPNFTFAKDVVIAKTLIKRKYKAEREMMLFSGGVDAFNTLINVYNPNLTPFCVLGADVPLSNKFGIHNITNRIKKSCSTFDLSPCFCKSNFKSFLKYRNLNRLINNIDHYWHGFQHGLGLTTLTAPIAFKHKVGKVYIASSFSVNEEKFRVRGIASHPTIDNHIKFLNASVVHNGTEFDRLDKVRNISNWIKEHNQPLNVHVCWEKTSGNNCCKCEKCIRTIFSICALGIVSPQQFGFNIKKNFFEKSKNTYLKKPKKFFYQKGYYKTIQQALTPKSPYYEDLKWLKTLEL